MIYKLILILILTLQVISTPHELSTAQTSSPPHNFSPDNIIIQQVFQGLYAQNSLQGPYMTKYCFDDQVSHEIVVFTTEILAKAAKASITDLLQVIKLMREFSKTIPDETIDCLGRCEQIHTLGFKYDIDGSTDFVEQLKHVETYVALHFLEVHKWAIDLNEKWISGAYRQFGYAAGGYGHKILNMAS